MNMMTSRRVGMVLGFLVAVPPLIQAAPTLADWKPERNVEFVVGTAPGSGIELQAREIQKIIQDKKLLPTTSTVVNKPGGANSVALTYVNQHPGDGHYLTMVALQLLTNKITGVNPQNYTDVTPIAVIGTQAIGAAVRSDSPIKSAKELVDRLKANPEALNVGLASSRGSGTHIGFSLAMNAGGVNPAKLKIIVFSSSSKALTALLGGHVDVVTAPSSAITVHKKAGKVRVLAVGTEKRLSGEWADVPTWKEQGIDVVFSIPYGLALPKGTGADEVVYWDSVFKQVFTSPEWKTVAERTDLDDTYLDSKGSLKFWEANDKAIRPVLTELSETK